MNPTILKYVLHNALKFGKPNPGAVIGKIIAEDPGAKAKIKEISKEVQEAIKEADGLSKEAITAKIMEIDPSLLDEKPKEKKEGLDALKALDGADNGVVMRFAPSPSGPMHIGHAATGCLSSEYVRKYGGKLVLRIEDTNADKIDPAAYELLEEDGKWIFGNVSEVVIQSDRMELYYEYAQKLLALGAMYVCTCSQEGFKEHATKMTECPCRAGSIADQHLKWEQMFDTFKPGEAVVRFKGDMQHKNPAMRDFPLFRINDAEHPRQGKKFRVWPLMNFSVLVDDIELGMTHVIRAKDHADNARRQEMMYAVLKKTPPKTYFVGKIQFIGLELSATKTKERIKAGEYTGWDDIRLPFLGAMRRRGYVAEAFRKYSTLVGLSPVDKSVDASEYFKLLNAYNKEIIDPKSHRYFFVADPVELLVKGAPKQEVELDLHPDHAKGGRKFSVGEHFLIEKQDAEAMKQIDGLVRLMDCVNVKAKDNSYLSISFEDYKEKGKKIIHWLPQGQGVKAELVMPDGSVLSGLAESRVADLDVGSIVQFERHGFCRLDSKGDVLRFWFGHR